MVSKEMATCLSQGQSNPPKAVIWTDIWILDHSQLLITFHHKNKNTVLMAIFPSEPDKLTAFFFFFHLL